MQSILTLDELGVLCNMRTNMYYVYPFCKYRKRLISRNIKIYIWKIVNFPSLILLIISDENIKNNHFCHFDETDTR